jgi:predicted nucleotide-binding protein
MGGPGVHIDGEEHYRAIRLDSAEALRILLRDAEDRNLVKRAEGPVPAHYLTIDGYTLIDDSGNPSRLAVRSTSPRGEEGTTMAADPRKVAVVHGRNDAARKGLFAFLRALDLNPVEWESAVAATGKGAPYNKEVLASLFDMTQAVVVLFTGDEEVTLLPALRQSSDPPDPRRQARANVFVEAGMAFVANPERTILLVFGPQEVPSDLHGLNYVRFDGSPASRNKVKLRLTTAGCAVREASDWLHAGEGDMAAALTTAASGPAHAAGVDDEPELGDVDPVSLTDEQEEVLEIIARSEANFMTDAEVSAGTRKSRAIAQMHLEELTSYQYLSVERVPMVGQCYRVTPKGTKYLVKRGLLD